MISVVHDDPQLTLPTFVDGYIANNVASGTTHLVGVYVRLARIGRHGGMDLHDPQKFAHSVINTIATVRSLLDSLPALCVVVLEFGLRLSWIDIAAEMDPTIREPLSSTRNITYRFSCATDPPNRTFPDIHPSRDVHVMFDPATLQRTGMIDLPSFVTFGTNETLRFPGEIYDSRPVTNPLLLQLLRRYHPHVNL